MQGDDVEVRDVPSSAQKSRQESRDPDYFAIHSQDVLDAAQALGESLHNGQVYVGLTYTRLIELLKELGIRRNEMTEFRIWLRQEFPVEFSDGQELSAARRLMGDVKTMATSLWPHLLTMWTNVSYVLRNAGVIPRSNKD